MKLVAKILLGLYVLVGMLFSVMGFAWQTVLGKADVNTHFDHVYQAKQAYIDKYDDLYICVDGKYDDEKREYWIGVPVIKIETIPEKLDQAHGYTAYWKESYKQRWHLPRENIVVSACASKPTTEKRPVEIAVIDAGMTGSYETENIVNTHFENAGKDELVYQLNVTDGAAKPISKKDLAYANKQSLFEDKHVFTFETNSYRRSGSKLWFLVLPFAWALDVVAWPIELMMWIEYAGAH